MASKRGKSMSLLRLIILGFVVFQFYSAFSPPIVSERSLRAAKVVSVEELAANINHFVNQPVNIRKVRVEDPVFFYFGGLYYMKALETNSRILVLTSKYPPKENSIVSISGFIKPVASFNNYSFAYFKQARITVVDSP